MTTYLQPQEVRGSGRRLTIFGVHEYEKLRGLLRPGERLCGLYDQGRQEVAPVLESEKEFNAFEDQYIVEGRFIARDFYAVPEAPPTTEGALATLHAAGYPKMPPPERGDPA